MRTARVLLLILARAQAGIHPGTGCATTDPAIVGGDTLLTEGRYQEAHDLFAAALTKLERQPEPTNNPDIPCVMDRISIGLIRMGRLSEARDWSIRAIDRSRTLASPHPAAAILVNNLAVLYMELGDLSSAERYARESLALVSNSANPNHPDRQLALTTLAAIYAYRLDYARAEPLFREILFHLERIHGPNHIDAGLAATNLAEIYRIQRRYSEAALLYRKAAGIFESLSTGASWEIWKARAGLMVSCEYSGRVAEAQTLAAQFEAAEPDLTPNDVRLASLLHDLALVRIHRKEFAAARANLERALAILESVYGPSSPRMIAPLLSYVQVLRDSNDKQAAKRTGARIKVLTQSLTPPR
ncbi:MAG: tetratricopeptide repeat protein [Acidobacteriota bacterium]